MPNPPERARLRDFPYLVGLRRDVEQRRQLFTQPDLTYFFWECTLRCNLRCTHCGSSCGPTRKDDELTTEQICAILDTIGEDFDCSRMFVSITGGEPLLREDLYEVVAHMTSLGLRSCIVTNGTLLTPERAARLYDAGMRTITISVDGNERTHDAVRGEGTFVRTLQGITNAWEAGFEVVEAITCVRPANLPVLSLVERAVREAGANCWRLITIDRIGRLAGTNDDEFWMEPPQINHLFEFIEQRRTALQRDGDDFDVGFSCGGYIGTRREKVIRGEHNQCHAGLCVGSVLSDGQVSACPSMPRTWAQGNALETRFSEIWFNRFADYRDEGLRREGPCEDCSWFDVCLGGGLHERLAQPDRFCWLDRQRE